MLPTPRWSTARDRRTERLCLSQLAVEDAPFILTLLNDPLFIRYVVDRGVRDLDGAERYILEGPRKMYLEHGIGLLKVALLHGPPIGICGLLQRDSLPHPDLGFALLPSFRGCGLAEEAAVAVIEDGFQELNYTTILATTHPDNLASQKLLLRLGFVVDEAREFDRESAKLFRLKRKVRLAGL